MDSRNQLDILMVGECDIYGEIRYGGGGGGNV